MAHGKAVTLVTSRDRLIADKPGDIGRRAQEWLEKRGVQVGPYRHERPPHHLAGAAHAHCGNVASSRGSGSRPLAGRRGGMPVVPASWRLLGCRHIGSAHLLTLCCITTLNGCAQRFRERQMCCRCAVIASNLRWLCTPPDPKLHPSVSGRPAGAVRRACGEGRRWHLQHGCRAAAGGGRHVHDSWGEAQYRIPTG